MAKLTVKRLVAILEKVPEKRFRIAELAPQVLDDKGKVDIAKAIDLQGELNLAVVEVQSYIRATKTVVGALLGISGTLYRDEDWDWELGEEIEIEAEEEGRG